MFRLNTFFFLIDLENNRAIWTQNCISPDIQGSCIFFSIDVPSSLHPLQSLLPLFYSSSSCYSSYSCYCSWYSCYMLFIELILICFLLNLFLYLAAFYLHSTMFLSPAPPLSSFLPPPPFPSPPPLFPPLPPLFSSPLFLKNLPNAACMPPLHQLIYLVFFRSWILSLFSGNTLRDNWWYLTQNIFVFVFFSTQNFNSID